MLKEARFIFIVAVITLLFISCSEPKRQADINNDGGLSFLLEAPVADIIRSNSVKGDTLIDGAIKLTQEVISSSNGTFIEIFVQELYKNANGADIKLAGLRANASASECSQYLIKKTAEVAETSKRVILKRLDLAGIENPIVRLIGNAGQILVQLPRVTSNPRLYELLQVSGRLEFWETYENSEVYPILEQINTRLKELNGSGLNAPVILESEKIDSTMSLEEQMKRANINQDQSVESLRKENPLFAYLSPATATGPNSQTILAEGPAIGYAIGKDTALINSYFQKKEIKSIIGRSMKFMWFFKPVYEESNTFQLIAIRVKNINGGPALAGNIMDNAKKQGGEAGFSPQIRIQMTPNAAIIWQNITRSNTGQCIAMVVDEKVYSYPRVQSEIKGGISSITGNFTEEEVDDLTALLNSGRLPVRLKLLEEKIIPPLGK